MMVNVMGMTGVASDHVVHDAEPVCSFLCCSQHVKCCQGRCFKQRKRATDFAAKTFGQQNAHRGHCTSTIVLLIVSICTTVASSRRLSADKGRVKSNSL